MSDFRILLIKPNVCVRRGFDLQSKKAPPIGLAYLAGSLIDAGYDTKIIDMVAESDNQWPFRDTHIAFGLNDKELIQRIKEYGPNLVGIGGFTAQYPRIKEIILAIKGFDPSIKIVLGGIHATAVPVQVMEQTEADFIIQGEGEEAIVELAKALEVGASVEGVDGIVYRNGYSVIAKPKLRYITDLDSLPLPAHSILRHENYLSDRVAMPVITSRSCPGRCTFCSVHLTMGKKWRKRDPVLVVDEIESLVDLGYKTISIFDDAANVLPERLIEISKETLRRNLDVRLTFPGLIINNITKDLLYWIKKAGAVSISLPIEHVNEYMRNTVIKKKLKMEKIDEVLSWCREVGLLVLVNFVLGMPGETEETLQEIVGFVKENARRFDSVSIYIATPYPGTKFYSDCQERGMLVGLGEGDFLDFDQYTAHIETPTMSHEVIDRYKEIIDRTFEESREDGFSSKYIRKAIRKPTKETMDYIENVYFKNI